MDKAKQHWKILQELGTDLASRVREFMVIAWKRDGDGLVIATEDGLGFWLGTMQFVCGDRSESRTSTQPTLLNVPGIVQMAHSECHILLLNKRGEIYSMGKNEHGELGLGTVDEETYFSPQLIPASPHKFISVQCGIRYSVALTEDGKCWAWGWNKYCQVGLPSSTISIPSPHQISELDPHRIVAVECGGHHSLALTDRGEVYAWGSNGFGQFGDGTTQKYHLTPIRIPIPSPVQSIAAGYLHTLLLTLAGEVWACGWNGCGQLGLPTTTESSPSLVKVPGLPSISQIASHPSTNLSISMSSDKRCFVWGRMRDENLEDIDISLDTPRKLSPDYSTVDSPLAMYSTHRSTSHSISIPVVPPSRLSTRMSRMFDNPETSDVQFVVEQRTIHAHRIILSNSSDYFNRMFSERWMASVDPEDPIVRVTIPDHSYEIFHSFLRFLYTDYLEVHFDLLPELFELASQYLESDLHQLCLSRMRTTITTFTCCLYYPLTHRHSLPELVADIVQFASTRMSEITPTAAYHSMEPDLRDQLTNAVLNFLDI